MAPLSIPARIPFLLRQQQRYIAVAVAIYVVLSVTMRKPGDALINPIPTLIYTIALCNMVALLQFAVGRDVERKGQHWFVFLIALLALTPLMVIIATFFVFLVTPGTSRFWPFVRAGWQFPTVATVIFGTVSEIYRYTTTGLEKRNRELQVAVDIETAQREFQEQELERAREIQQGLLPKTIPQIPGFEIAGAWEPARVVGGDYYDMIQLSESKLGICIADVVGKGVSAALLMANVQATLRAFASETASPAWLCGRMNSVLCSNIASGKFVTLFYGVLDSETRTLKYTSAGHNPPILISRDGASRTLDNSGALLGVLPNWAYEDSTVSLVPGDRVLLFTDGITEATRSDGDEFGESRLAKVAAGRVFESAATLNSSLVTEVSAFCNSQFQDDATLVVIAAT